VLVLILILSLSRQMILPVEIAVACILLVVLLQFSSLTVVVQDGSVTCRFGPGIIRKRIPLASISDARPVTNSWLAGWGIRWIPGHYWLWNVSGLQAVELEFRDGGRFRIGTDEPEVLARAILASLPKGVERNTGRGR
jgi:hypothetical protein